MVLYYLRGITFFALRSFMWLAHNLVCNQPHLAKVNWAQSTKQQVTGLESLFLLGPGYCPKKGPIQKLIRISTDPSPFNQREVNFVENMFYNELTPDDKCPASGTLGAPVLEEEEGSNTHGLRDPWDRKRQKKQISSSRSRECVVI